MSHSPLSLSLLWACPCTNPTSCEELAYWKRPWCWEGLGARGEGDDRGWDGWMASPTQWTWVWVNSRSWWWTGRPGVLRFMGSQRVGHDLATKLNWTELKENVHPPPATFPPTISFTHPTFLQVRCPWLSLRKGNSPRDTQPQRDRAEVHLLVCITYNPTSWSSLINWIPNINLY